MKNKLLSVSNGKVLNIGDYIQALAASQFLPSIDGFINREELSTYDGDECRMIMNGWFMHHPENWPPSDKIKPLFVAFHLNESVKNQMLTKEGIKYLKKYEPIGCRDQYTASILAEAGVDSYFSGCLTLTLGNKYKSNNRTQEVIVVDPMIPDSKSAIDLLKDVVAFIAYFSSILKIAKKLYPTKTGLMKYVYTSRFYRCYTQWIEKDDLENATYIQQETEYYVKGFKDDYERLAEAERLVQLYSRAQYVLTSRIHCALPCLGVGTPVYFAIKDNLDFISSCRFGGLIELFNVFRCTNNAVVPTFAIKGRIGKNNIISNKDSWVDLANNLTKKCNEFIKS